MVWFGLDWFGVYVDVGVVDADADVVPALLLSLGLTAVYIIRHFGVDGDVDAVLALRLLLGLLTAHRSTF